MRIQLALPLVAVLWSGTALAQTAPISQLTNPADITILASTCVGCHGVTYEGAHGVPALRGNKAEDITGMLRAFKANERQPVTMMNRLAKGYSEAEIDALGAHFAQMK